jgi:hypothetical protein
MKKAILYVTLVTLFVISETGHARNQYLGMDVIIQEVYTGNGSTPPATGTLSTKVVGSTINVSGVTTYKNVVVDSGTIAISNQNPNVFVTSGTITINNLNPSYKDVVISSGNVTNDDIRYSGKISSGTAGIITGTTSATITISDKVCNYSFIMKNAANIGEYINILNSITVGADYLADGDYISVDIVVPAAITFNLNSLPVSCTIQYHINTIK